MSKSYLKLPFKKFAKQNGVFDILIYGSAVKGKEKPRDTDILLVFLDKKLGERLAIAQKFKQVVKTKVKNPDVKTINLSELFESNFLARQGILVEGYSLLHKTSLSKRLGFEGYALFTYNLKNLNHNEKTKFTYSLIGRRGDGMVKNVKGKALGKGAVIIPIENSLIFEDFLKKWSLDYTGKKILVSLL